MARSFENALAFRVTATDRIVAWLDRTASFMIIEQRRPKCVRLFGLSIEDYRRLIDEYRKASKTTGDY